MMNRKWWVHLSVQVSAGLLATSCITRAPTFGTNTGGTNGELTFFTPFNRPGTFAPGRFGLQFGEGLGSVVGAGILVRNAGNGGGGTSTSVGLGNVTNSVTGVGTNTLGGFGGQTTTLSGASGPGTLMGTGIGSGGAAGPGVLTSGNTPGSNIVTNPTNPGDGTTGGAGGAVPSTPGAP